MIAFCKTLARSNAAHSAIPRSNSARLSSGKARTSSCNTMRKASNLALMRCLSDSLWFGMGVSLVLPVAGEVLPGQKASPALYTESPAQPVEVAA